MWLHGSNRALMRRTLRRGWAASTAATCSSTTSASAMPMPTACRPRHSVACPVTFILGRNDQMTPPKVTQDLAAALKARVVTVDSGHSLMAEAPDAVLAALRGALQPA
jgi:pimeloyl-ACP methyl ester carboxylesterase